MTIGAGLGGGGGVGLATAADFGASGPGLGAAGAGADFFPCMRKPHFGHATCVAACSSAAAKLCVQIGFGQGIAFGMTSKPA